MRDGTRLVRILARKFANTGIDEEDLFQEGMLAYIKAESTFDPKRDVKLETYASRVITNRFIDILRKRPDIDAVIDDEKTISDYNLDDQINLIEIKKILREQINDLERAIFNSYIEGFSYEEIGKIFELPRKKIDNIVQKVKRIIKSNI